MNTTGSKFFFGAALFGFVGAVVYGLSTGGDPLGVVSFGLYTGVGEHVGYSLLMTLAAGGFFLGVMALVYRDGEAEAGPSVAEVEEIVAGPQASPSFWPAATAIGITMLALGVVTSWPFFLGGIGILVICAIEWMVQAWSDRATGDPVYNRELRNRVMLPFEIPIGAALGIGIVVIAFSRVLLAVPKMGAVVVAIGVATTIVLVATLLAWRPRFGSGVVAVLCSVGAVAVISSGIVAAYVGERDIEEHGAEHAEPEGEELRLTAKDVKYEPTTLQAPAVEPFTIFFSNEDEGVEHNLHVEGIDGATTEIEAGPNEQLLVLHDVAPGTYQYMCDVHPDQMKGELEVG